MSQDENGSEVLPGPQGQPELTEEQKAQAEELTVAAAEANWLMANDNSFTKAVTAMLAARQLYIVTTYELDGIVQQLAHRRASDADKKIPLTDAQKIMIKEILINASAMQSQQPFNTEQLLAGLNVTVLPWLKMVEQTHSARQNDEKKEKFLKQEEHRASLTVDLGIEEFSKAKKGTSIVFVGKTDVLRFLSDKLTTHVTGLPDGSVMQVARLADFPTEVKSARLHTLAADWDGCAATNTSFPRLYHEKLLPSLNNPIDVLVVDNLVRALGQESNVLPAATLANEAQHKLRKWVAQGNALLLSFIPLDAGLSPNELHHKNYEALRTHNALRAVVAVEDGDNYKIMIGTKEWMTVPKGEVDSYNQAVIELAKA